jgi:hypothetical protein
VQASNEISFLKQNERKFWQDLVDSNIRAGTIACLWCLKAQLIKKTSVAFNKWKLYAACKVFETKNRELVEMKSSLDSRENDTVQNAISVLHKYRSGSNSNSNDSTAIGNPNKESSNILDLSAPGTKAASASNINGLNREVINDSDPESKRKFLRKLLISNFCNSS